MKYAVPRPNHCEDKAKFEFHWVPMLKESKSFWMPKKWGSSQYNCNKQTFFVCLLTIKNDIIVCLWPQTNHDQLQQCDNLFVLIFLSFFLSVFFSFCIFVGNIEVDFWTKSVHDKYPNHYSFLIYSGFGGGQRQRRLIALCSCHPCREYQDSITVALWFVVENRLYRKKIASQKAPQQYSPMTYPPIPQANHVPPTPPL